MRVVRREALSWVRWTQECAAPPPSGVMSNLNEAFTFLTVSALMRFWMAANTADDFSAGESAEDSEDDIAEDWGRWKRAAGALGRRGAPVGDEADARRGCDEDVSTCQGSGRNGSAEWG